MAQYSIFFLLAYAYFLVNYFVPNGFFYWLCWKAQFPWWANNRIQKDREPRPDQVETEIKSSLKSLAWYAAIATFVFYCYRHGYTSMTTAAAPLGYHLLSLLVLMLLHDTSFYWIHRLLHTRKLFQLVHKHHHDSRAPTPWAAYSLSAGESIVQCPLWVLCFTMPAHPLVVLAVFFFAKYLRYVRPSRVRVLSAVDSSQQMDLRGAGDALASRRTPSLFPRKLQSLLQHLGFADADGAPAIFLQARGGISTSQ